MTTPDDARWTQIAHHRDRLLRIAMRRCPNRQEAEDVVADAMLAAATYDALDLARLGPLLTALTVRLAANAARRRGVAQRALPRLVDPGDDATDAVLTSAEARWLDGVAVATLTAVERSVLLYRADGFSTAAAASALAITERAAASALTRARKKLHAAWRATLGVLGLRNLRRYAPAVSAAAFVVLFAATTGGLRPGDAPHVAALPRSVAPPVTYTTPSTPSRAAIAQVPGRAAATRSVHTTVEPPPNVTPPTLNVQPVRVPLAHAGSRGAAITLDRREPFPTRVARCTRHGAHVDMSRYSVSVICGT